MSPSKKTATRARDDSHLNWEPIEELPDDDPSVILVFHGLMGLAYNRDLDFCEVGMHSKAPKHEFSIEVYDDLTSQEPMYAYKFGQAGSALVDIIRFDVVNPSVPGSPGERNVRFYMPPGFNRHPTGAREVPDDLDFRLITDFEGPDFYNRPLRKKPGAFKPIVHIKNGVFVTLAPTRREYNRVAPNDSLPLGQIAEAVGAAIYLNPGDGFVALRIGTSELKLRAAEGKTSVIYFDNSCPEDDCQFRPTSSKKETRNDFYLYYETFEIPSDKEEYELIEKDPLLNASASAPKPPGDSKTASDPKARVSPKFRQQLFEFIKLRSNPEAPCGSAGYGQSSSTGGS